MSRAALPKIRPIRDEEFGQLDSIENDADFVLIETLRPKRWDPAPPGSSRRGHDGFVLVAQDDAASHQGELDGFIDIRYVQAATAYIDALAVRRRSMRRGLGRRLLREAALTATNSGRAFLTLRTYRSIAFNGPFYASEGFVTFTPPSDAQWATDVLTAERKAGLPRLEDRVFMRLPLEFAR